MGFIGLMKVMRGSGIVYDPNSIINTTEADGFPNGQVFLILS